MSIKFKLWILALIPMLCVTLFGIFSILWITYSQQQKLIKETLIANINQLENEVEFAVTQLENTLKEQVIKDDFISSALSLYKIKNSIPELRRTFQCETITGIQKLTIEKEYDTVALYNPESIESYATKDHIYVASKNQREASVQHFTPTLAPIFQQCSSKEWNQSESPTRLPEKIDIPTDFSTYFSMEDGQLDLIGILPITEEIYIDGKAKTNPIGLIFLSENLTKTFMQNFSSKTSILSDLFSPTGALLAGTHFKKIEQLPFEIDQHLKEGLFTEIYIDNTDYFMMIRPYYHQNRPAFLMASYGPKETVLSNSKKLFLLQIAGLIFGLVFAALVALFMEKVLLTLF